jgi:hypothetical protein
VGSVALLDFGLLGGGCRYIAVLLRVSLYIRSEGMVNGTARALNSERFTLAKLLSKRPETMFRLRMGFGTLKDTYPWYERDNTLNSLY